MIVPAGVRQHFDYADIYTVLPGNQYSMKEMVGHKARGVGQKAH
jgi:hypothetical protein